MADKQAIKAAILKVAGDPSVGAIHDLADAMADAVAALDAETGPVRYQEAVKAQKETRVIDARETR